MLLRIGLGVVLVFVCLGAPLTVMALYARRAAQLPQHAPPGAWTAGSIEAGSGRTVKGLVIDDSGVRLSSLWTRATLAQWSWAEIDVRATRAQTMSVGLREGEGLHLEFGAEPPLDLLFPAGNPLRYAPEKALAALSEIQRRAGSASDRQSD